MDLGRLLLPDTFQQGRWRQGMLAGRLGRNEVVSTYFSPSRVATSRIVGGLGQDHSSAGIGHARLNIPHVPTLGKLSRVACGQPAPTPLEELVSVVHS